MIELKHIEKSFNINTVNAVHLYHDLNLHIREGEFVSVIGSNGSGKSTLFNLIAGNIRPDRGELLYRDRSIVDLSEHLRARMFSRVYQDPLKGASPALTILENMAMAYNKGKKFGLRQAVQGKDIAYFKNLLSSLDLALEDKLNVHVRSLSGGQRQALSLLMATMVTPELLLLDEHTAALDPKTSDIIIKLTDKIVRDKQITTLMITHNLGQAISTGDRLIMLHQGNIVMDIDKEHKKNLSVAELIERFNQLKLTESLSDEMILQ